VHVKIEDRSFNRFGAIGN